MPTCSKLAFLLYILLTTFLLGQYEKSTFLWQSDKLIRSGIQRIQILNL